MKLSFSILVLAIGCGALNCQVAHAIAADQVNAQQQTRLSDPQQGQGHVAEKSQSQGHKNLAKPGVPKPPASGRARSTSAAAAKVHRSALSRSNGATSAMAAARQAGGKVNSVQPRAVPHTSEAPSVAPRHHSPNPAKVGGATTFSAANTGGINGTHMRRRP